MRGVDKHKPTIRIVNYLYGELRPPGGAFFSPIDKRILLRILPAYRGDTTGILGYI